MICQVLLSSGKKLVIARRNDEANPLYVNRPVECAGDCFVPRNDEHRNCFNISNTNEQKTRDTQTTNCTSDTTMMTKDQNPTNKKTHNS